VSQHESTPPMTQLKGFMGEFMTSFMRKFMPTTERSVRQVKTMLNATVYEIKCPPYIPEHPDPKPREWMNPLPRKGGYKWKNKWINPNKSR